MFAEEAVNPVAFDVPNMFWGAIFFAVLLVLMYTVCLPPVRKAMQQRIDDRRLDEEAADRAGQDAEQVRRDYDATLAEARAEAARIVNEARATVEAERSARVAEVEAELATKRQEVMAEFETQRTQALAAIMGDVAGLATAAASKVVQMPLDVAAQRSVIDQFVATATVQ